MRTSILALAILFGLFSSIAQAQSQQQQKRPTPNEIQQFMEMTFDTQLKVAEKPETGERIAAFKKNLFEALKKKGFTPEQALQITIMTDIPAEGQ